VNSKAKMKFWALIISYVGNMQLFIGILLEICSVFWKVATFYPAQCFNPRCRCLLIPYLHDEADSMSARRAHVVPGSSFKRGIKQFLHVYLLESQLSMKLLLRWMRSVAKIGPVVCLLAVLRPSCLLMRAMDGRIVRCGISNGPSSSLLYLGHYINYDWLID